MTPEPENHPNEIKRPPHPFVNDVKKMLREYNLQWDTPQVVANLTLIAERMTIELLKDAVSFSSKTTDPPTLEKSDIELAIKLMNQDEVKLPDEDALIDAAVAVNGNPLFMKEIDGVALPKNNLGNCNYQLHNASDLMEMQEEEQEYEEPQSFYTYIMPYDNYLPNHDDNMEDGGGWYDDGYDNVLPQLAQLPQHDQHHIDQHAMYGGQMTPQGSESPSSSIFDDTIPPENCGFCYDD